MEETVKQAVVDANAAELDLVRAIDAASDALDKVAINPLAGSLARLEASAVAAQERLQAGRERARQVLGQASSGFASFREELAGGKPAAVPALPAPKPRTRRGRGRGNKAA
jgi:hypothetical protein